MRYDIYDTLDKVVRFARTTSAKDTYSITWDADQHGFVFAFVAPNGERHAIGAKPDLLALVGPKDLNDMLAETLKAI
jgi:hypothetical protein